MPKIRYYLSLIFCLVLASQCFAQWSGTYGNEWINYSKPYYKIKVSSNGVHKIDSSVLPSEFRGVNPEYFQIWHRGQQIAVIKADNQEILFYGRKNDGSSDSLLYRPTSARLNPYVSFYSDNSAYFLTFDSSAKGKRASQLNGADLSGELEKHHFQKEVRTFKDQFAFTMLGVETSLNHSYFVEGNTWTGKSIVGPKARITSSAKDSVFLDTFELGNWAKELNIDPVFEIMVNGTNEGLHNLEVYLGKSTTDLQKITTFSFRGWGSKKYTSAISSALFDTGKATIKMFSTSTDYTDWSSVTYHSVTYPQWMDMSGFGPSKSSYEFNINIGYSLNKGISIANPPSDLALIDISKVNDPIIVRGISKDGSYQAMLSQKNNITLKLLAINPTSYITVSSDAISTFQSSPIYSDEVKGVKLDPKNYDYLIITHSGLKDASIKYAEYRSSQAGGGFKVLVMDIADIYDQFNYGEPSPIAIRRFADYMLKEGIRDHHNLLLLGPSISYQASMIKELPGEVPTFGDPGSDNLLVAGLSGTNIDVPAIPVGRVNARSSQDAIDYLDKVKTYESQKDNSWKKNVLHLSGGKSAAEITQLKGILENLDPYVESGEFSGIVKQYVKQSPGEPEAVDISTEVNNGVGLITFFGHGSSSVIDLDFGNVSDVSRGYTTTDKYPLMYFNGCGVGNIFFRKSRTLADDWLLGSGKGAIAVLANSYYSYVGPSQKHLIEMYSEMFSTSGQKSIGQILIDAANNIVAGTAGEYDINNIHQLNIMGDPAIVFIKDSTPDYAISTSKDIFLKTISSSVKIGDSDKVNIGVVINNLGSFRIGDKIPLRVTIESSGRGSTIYSKNVAAVANRDTVYFEHSLNSDNIINILAYIDPDKTLDEQNLSNNFRELAVDWSIASDQYIYFGSEVDDKIKPLIEVSLNGITAKNKSVVPVGPVILVNIDDDHFLLPEKDLLSIYIKKCWDESCNFEEVDLNDGNFKSISDNSIQVTVPENLLAGKYEILVYAQDMSGNRTEIGYRLIFEVSDSLGSGLSYGILPNPASNYVKVVSEHESFGELLKVDFKVFNLLGQEVFSKEIIPDDVTKVGAHLEWYWNCTTFDRGLYILKSDFIWSDNSKNSAAKKVILN